MSIIVNVYMERGGGGKPPIFIPINAILSPEMYLGKKKKRPTPALLRLCFLSLFAIICIIQHSPRQWSLELQEAGPGMGS